MFILIIILIFALVKIYNYLCKYNTDSYYNRISKEIDGLEHVKIPINYLKISSPSICNIIYMKNLNVPDNLGLGNLFKRWLGLCMGNFDAQNPVWSNLKKIFKPLFDAKIDKLIEELTQDWESNLKMLRNKTFTNDDKISLEDIVDDLPLKFITQLIFGKTFMKNNEKNFNELQKCAKKLMWEIFNNEEAKYDNYKNRHTETNIILNIFQSRWEYILNAAMNDKNVIEEGIYDKIYRNYSKTKNINHEMFSHTLIEIIYANQDVTIPSMVWLLVNYMKYNQFLENPEHFIEESGRLSPIFPTSMFKKTACDIKINNCIIRKGTHVCIDFIKIGKSKEWETDDLNDFNPKRFEKDHTKKLISRFGFGGRKCPGRKITNKLFISVMEILRNKYFFTPTNPFNKQIDMDKTRPFYMPNMNVWILDQNNFKKIDDTVLYIDCNPKLEMHENAFIAISVNEKSPYLVQEKCDMLVKYITARQNKVFVIMIADKIAHHNLQAFNRYKKAKSINKALELGDKFIHLFSNSIETYGEKKVKLCRWDDLKIPEMHEELLTFKILDKRITAIANVFLSHRGASIKTSYHTKIGLIKKYICSELPVLVCGVHVNDTWHRLLYYSGYMTHLKKIC